MMRKVLSSLFPRSHPLKLAQGLRGTFGELVKALSESLERARQFVALIRSESSPSSADQTLAEWYAQLNIRYDPTLSLADRRARARQAWAALGGQSPEYLQDTIQVAFPDVTLTENLMSDYTDSMAGVGQAGLMQAQYYPTWTTDADDDGRYQYLVSGEVDTFANFDALQNLIENIMPAQLEPIYEVTIQAAEPTAEAGIAMAGFAQSGRLQGE